VYDGSQSPGSVPDAGPAVGVDIDYNSAGSPPQTPVVGFGIEIVGNSGNSAGLELMDQKHPAGCNADIVEDDDDLAELESLWDHASRNSG